MRFKSLRTNVLTPPANFLYFDNFIRTFIDGKFQIAFKNSFVLVVVGALGSAALGMMTAYCISRFTFAMKPYITFIYILAAAMPSSIVLAVPIYRLMALLHFTSSFKAPILMYLGTDMTQIWIYLQYMSNISVSLDESGMIEGASYFRIFRSIIVPLLMPATAVVVILRSITIYNDMFIMVREIKW